MVMYGRSRINGDLSGGELHPAVMHACLVGIGKEKNWGPIRNVCSMRDSREAF
jgi:hypothetical protein